jgi:betaine-aldehyde dehydrogenase
MAEICQEFPRGVLNVLTGLGEECGGPLAEHPLVGNSFTGSTEVGKIITRGGGTDRAGFARARRQEPVNRLPRRQRDWVVDGVIAAMRFTRQSQSCTAGSRLFLHADIFDSFLDKLRHRTAVLKLGDPLDEATDIGSIINEKQFRKVCAYIEEGLQRKAAQRIFGGLPPKEGPLSEGYFAIPTVFADASNDWRLAREEIFGPVLVAIPWHDEADAIRMANDSHYGLAAYVWTHDIGGHHSPHAIGRLGAVNQVSASRPIHGGADKASRVFHRKALDNHLKQECHCQPQHTPDNCGRE